MALFPLAILAAIKPAFRVAPITSLIMLLPPTGQAIGPLASAIDRVLEITLGNIVGVVVSLFVLPARAHTLMTEAAAKVVSLNAELFSVFIGELTADPNGRSALQKLHPQIRSALKKAEAAAEEAMRERRSHLTDAPDPEPLIRTLYRVRHDLVMIGRAASSPLPAPVLERLGPRSPRCIGPPMRCFAIWRELSGIARRLRADGFEDALRLRQRSGGSAIRCSRPRFAGRAFGQVFALVSPSSSSGRIWAICLPARESWLERYRGRLKQAPATSHLRVLLKQSERLRALSPLLGRVGDGGVSDSLSGSGANTPTLCSLPTSGRETAPAPCCERPLILWARLLESHS